MNYTNFHLWSLGSHSSKNISCIDFTYFKAWSKMAYVEATELQIF